MDNDLIEQQIRSVLTDLDDKLEFRSVQLLVIGCSTSEITGKQIGKASSMEIAEIITREVLRVQKQHGFHLAVQCCEHLNRALVVERQTAVHFNLELVQAIPVPTAGGAFPTCIHREMLDPVLVLDVSADAGIDIGDTFIGMHLKRVAVPVRPVLKEVGLAHVTSAKARPLLIGGDRAVYDNSGI